LKKIIGGMPVSSNGAFHSKCSCFVQTPPHTSFYPDKTQVCNYTEHDMCAALFVLFEVW